MALANHNPLGLDTRRGTVLAAVGTTALSFDGLLVRLAGVPGWDVVFWRGLFIALSMTLVCRLLRRRWVWQAAREGGIPAFVTGLGYAITMIFFVMAILNTRVANVMVILTAAPLFAALISGIFLREWVPRRTWVAMLLCIAGIIIVFAGSFGLGGWLGDLYALLAAFCFGLNLTILRRHGSVDRMAMVALAGLFACLIAAPFAEPLRIGWDSLFWLAIMGLVQMPLAMGLMAEATRYIPAAEVSLFLLVETILGTLWVWMLLAEEPPSLTVAGGLLIVVTLAVHTWIGWQIARGRSSWRWPNGKGRA
ncbi:drug/metabolite transporter (DMT)-like permease [Natronocella acetinitrilica]|uniref:Drug/metabolite transporter (DMT)-like permease n=1 Tax=Natronocella acetinitrilica TaxID=414046 RepID=A0AAE3G3L8_9GAMM|nr:DMT family transporter [Natronocella acetinitrilica]MCP1675175.1 drug/metabolite transporter (DMT)-like permease [Natronocella acetinitrilica]